jgi:hypothetical protein
VACYPSNLFSSRPAVCSGRKPPVFYVLYNVYPACGFLRYLAQESHLDLWHLGYTTRRAVVTLYCAQRYRLLSANCPRGRFIIDASGSRG